MKAPVIGLTGPGGVGKSTVARALGIAWASRFPARRDDPAPMPEIIPIGEPLKDMLSALLARAGLEDAAIRHWIHGDGKRLACPALGGRTPTHAMQTLGTEWGRECIAPDLWLSIWSARTAAAQAQGVMVINDSVRFENEAAAIRDMGGLVVRLVGRSGDLAATHASEAGVVPDLEVENQDGPDGPAEAAEAILAGLLSRAAA